MQYVVCCVPVSPLRSEPSHKSEMVSQLLFGEKSIAIEQGNGWIKVRLKYDGYEGWCQQSHLTEIDEAHYTNVDKSSLIEQDTLLIKMQKCLKDLNIEQRQCVTLFYLEKKSYTQIAELTGFSMMQVKSHIQNGKRKLKLMMEAGNA